MSVAIHLFLCYYFSGGYIMRVALINDNSQANKNHIIYEALNKACKKYNHELINMGMQDEYDNPLTYVE